MFDLRPKNSHKCIKDCAIQWATPYVLDSCPMLDEDRLSFINCNWDIFNNKWASATITGSYPARLGQNLGKELLRWVKCQPMAVLRTVAEMQGPVYGRPVFCSLDLKWDNGYSIYFLLLRCFHNQNHPIPTSVLSGHQEEDCRFLEILKDFEWNLKFQEKDPDLDFAVPSSCPSSLKFFPC